MRVIFAYEPSPLYNGFDCNTKAVQMFGFIQQNDQLKKGGFSFAAVLMEDFDKKQICPEKGDLLIIVDFGRRYASALPSKIQKALNEDISCISIVGEEKVGIAPSGVEGGLRAVNLYESSCQSNRYKIIEVPTDAGYDHNQVLAQIDSRLSVLDGV